MYQTIQASELHDKLKNNEEVNFVDIRETYEHASGHAEGCKNIPMNELIYKADKHLDKDKSYYLICQSGGRSAMAAQYLISQGYQVVDVIGGHNVWPGRLVK